MADNPFLAADQQRRNAIQEEKQRKIREAEEEVVRQREQAKMSRRSDAMLAKGRLLVEGLKEKEKIHEDDALTRVRLAEERKEEEFKEQRRKELLARDAAEREAARKMLEAQRLHEEDLRKQAALEEVREQKRRAAQQRAQSYKEADAMAERRAIVLAEAKQLEIAVNTARKEGRLPPHFNPSITWLCQNLSVVKAMMTPAAPPPPSTPSRALHIRAERVTWISPIPESTTDDQGPTNSRSKLPHTSLSNPNPTSSSSSSSLSTTTSTNTNQSGVINTSSPSIHAIRANLEASGPIRPLFGSQHRAASSSTLQQPDGSNSNSNNGGMNRYPSASVALHASSPSMRTEDRAARLDRMQQIHQETVERAKREAADRMDATRVNVPTPNALTSAHTSPPTIHRKHSSVSHLDKQYVASVLDEVNNESTDDDVQESGPTVLKFAPPRNNLMPGGDALQYLSQREEIVTPSGTVRGRKHLVRSVLELFGPNTQFDSPLQERLFTEEKGKIVVYVTSVQAVRPRYEACQRVLKIFELMQLKIQVKDIAMDSRFISELESRLPESIVPQVFVSFIHIGDVDRICALNESGQLSTMLSGFEKRSIQPCGECGGFGYRPCSWCQGSKKSIMHSFSKDPGANALRCTVCNENGLEKCPSC